MFDILDRVRNFFGPPSTPSAATEPEPEVADHAEEPEGPQQSAGDPADVASAFGHWTDQPDGFLALMGFPGARLATEESYLDTDAMRAGRRRTESSEEAGVTNTASSNVSIGKGTGGPAIDVSRQRQTRVGDDQHLSSRSGMSYDDGTATASLGSSSTIKDPDLGGKVAESEEKKSSVSIGKKTEYKRERKQVTEVDGQTFTKGSDFTVNSDGVAAGRSRSHDDGQGNSRGSSTSVTAGPGGASASHAIERKNKDGSSASASASGGYDRDKGEISAAASGTMTSKSGTSASGGGNIAINEDGSLTSAGVNAGVKRKGWSASASGKYSVTASPPRKEGDKFVVDWERKLSGGVSGGAAKNAGGGKLGASASAEAYTKDFGTRAFNSEGEAEVFRKNAASLIGGAFGAETTAEDALTMQVGETRGTGDGTKLGGDVSAGWGVAEVGAGASKSSDDAVVIERLSPTLFQITIAHDQDSGTHGHVGVTGASIGGSESSGTGHSETVQFDLATADGRAAFEEYQRTKKLPETGAKKISETDAKRARHGMHFKLGPGTADITSSTFESVTRGQGHKREVYGGEFSHNVSSTIPFLEESDASSIKIAQTEIDDRERSYSMQGTVESKDGEDSMDHLAQMTGYASDKRGKQTSSGKWRVDVNLEEEHVDQFLDKLAAENVRDVGVFEYLSKPDHRNQLRQALQAAKTSDDKMRALSTFISETGMDMKGLKSMRDTIFGRTGDGIDSELRGNFHYDLHLEDDPHGVFNGIEGRMAIEAKLTEYTDLLSASSRGGGALVGSIQKDIDELKRRLAALEDPENYTDLPPELREKQLELIERQIDGFTQVRRIASVDAVKDGGPELEEGETETATPEVKRLRGLRREISDLDSKIARHKIGIQQLREAMLTVPLRASQKGARNRSEMAVYKAGQNAAARAAKREAKADEQRTRFVLALTDPHAAMDAGRAVKATLARIEADYALAESRYSSYLTFLDDLDDEMIEERNEQIDQQAFSMRLPD